MATYVLGLILAVLLGLAVRHVYRNFAEGRHDCCGCDACSAMKEKSSHAHAEAQKGCCCSHH